MVQDPVTYIAFSMDNIHGYLGSPWVPWGVQRAQGPKAQGSIGAHRSIGAHGSIGPMGPMGPPWVPWVPKGALYGVKGGILYHRTLFRHEWASYSSYGALDWMARNYSLLSIISQRFRVTLYEF